MTTSDPEQQSQPGGSEYPSLEDSAPQQDLLLSISIYASGWQWAP